MVLSGFVLRMLKCLFVLSLTILILIVYIIQPDNVPERQQLQQLYPIEFSYLKRSLDQVAFSPNLSDSPLNVLRRSIIMKERTKVLKEMSDIHFRMSRSRNSSDSINQSGDFPIRTLIFTTWRSGSTFVGELLNTHLSTYYHYEPLLYFLEGHEQLRSKSLSNEGLRVIKDLLNCRYDNLTEYMEFGKVHQWLFSHNTRIWRYCVHFEKICWDPWFLSTMCRMYPFQTLKTVRLGLRSAELLLNDPTLNVKILFLVRDPRGVLESRRHQRWCIEGCASRKLLCSFMENDYDIASKLRRTYPNRFLVMRYEDLSVNPYCGAQKLFHFFGLTYDSKIEKFLKGHTSSSDGDTYSTRRRSRVTPFKWKTRFSFEDVQIIQSSCSRAINIWGYNEINSEEFMRGFDPVGPPPWSDMIIN